MFPKSRKNQKDPKRKAGRAAGCLLEPDVSISCSHHVLTGLKNPHVIQVLSSKQTEHGEEFLESLWVPRFWEPICTVDTPPPEISQGKRLTAPEVQKKSVEQHGWKTVPGRKVWVDGVSHPHSSYPILWRMWTMSLVPAAPHKGALWLKEGQKQWNHQVATARKEKCIIFQRAWMPEWLEGERCPCASPWWDTGQDEDELGLKITSCHNYGDTKGYPSRGNQRSESEKPEKGTEIQWLLSQFPFLSLNQPKTWIIKGKWGVLVSELDYVPPNLSPLRAIRGTEKRV